jgi:hypothetical protein
VWLGNNRGSFNNEPKKSRKDNKRSPKDFWNWSFSDMGLYDLPAFILKMKEVTKKPKISYVGYDNGATELLYALAHREKDFFVKHLDKAIMMAPCVRPKLLNIEKKFEGYKQVFHPAAQGQVYNTFDPKWAIELRRLICHKLSVDYCMSYDYDHMALSVKTLEHMF